MSWIPGSRLVASISAAIVVFCPVAAADPGSPSYEQGKQAIDEQINHFHVQFTPDTDWNEYCYELMRGNLKRGAIHQVDSAPDFIAGCQDEGRALLASR